MPSPRYPLKLHRAVPEPKEFHPTKVWVKRPYVYRYDAERHICKRTPIDASALGNGGYFSVVPATTVKNRSLRPAFMRRWLESLVPRGAFAPKLFATTFVVAAAVFVYPFIPGVSYRLSHQPNVPRGEQLAKVAATQPAPASDPTNRVIIPSIGVNSPILESSTLAILDTREGVWHQTGTLESSNFVIAGHRFKYLPPNTTTFYNLDKLKAGDVVVVDWVGKRIVYTVSEVRTVNASDISVITPTPAPQLTIYTCSDKRETQRIVVIAKPLPE